VISHRDDVRNSRAERGHIAATWQSLTRRTSRTVGVKRIQVDPGMWATPLHGCYPLGKSLLHGPRLDRPPP
jgi:hypothetical protein